MAKGKKSKRKHATIEFPERSVTEHVVGEPQSEPVHLLKCSACGSWLDLTKTLETRCWLCGGYKFLNPDELELRKLEEKLKRKELCCPDPVCPRAVELLPNAEKYCGGCGAALEKASEDLWLRRCVEPRLAKNPQPSPSTWSQLVEEAWQMGLARERAESRLGVEVKRACSAAAPGTVKAATTGIAAAANARKRETVPTLLVPSRQTEHELKHKAEHLRRKIKIKYGVVIGGTLTFFLFVLAIGMLGRSDNSNRNGPTPSPPPPYLIAKPEPTPEQMAGMVFISGGKFWMGRDLKDDGDAYESPAHEVTVASFYMDAFEVTRAEYQKCVGAKVCQSPFGWTGHLYPPNTAQWPVTGVAWADANNYASWVGKSLPSEEEWEYAASGREGRRYPWGDSWDATQANVGTSSLVAVGRYKSYFGLFDLVGNAQEWTTSGWRQYPDKQTYMKTGDPPERLRIIRGGSYQSSPQEATLTYRNALRMREDLAEENHYEQTGFRCVQHDNQP
ncbi:MAG TPA: SUMF1/EgtB/PvdO family nonheme iron enzyme [Pyrinomonadaceae bacterium]|jgi:formylglycine-generating enzyme required for sulfatase activity|nr:SUMF1/EgtB/PvdO family nonheme iron enzyme [Pyrinomonadaceae bacterium]